jgi:hypothetical protein
MEARRKIARQQRMSPEELTRYRLIIQPSGQESWLPSLSDQARQENKAPAEIWIRLSSPAGQSRAEPVDTTVSWNFSDWLERVLPHWSSQRLEMYMTLFGSTFLNADFFEQLKILADRKLRWGTHFLTDGLALTSTATLDALLRSSLNELQVYVTGIGSSTVNRRVLEAVKDLVDLRRARRQNHPDIICRVCPGMDGGAELIRDLSLWVRQTGVDRLEVTDKVTEEKRLWGL